MKKLWPFQAIKLHKTQEDQILSAEPLYPVNLEVGPHMDLFVLHMQQMLD